MRRLPAAPTSRPALRLLTLGGLVLALSLTTRAGELEQVPTVDYSSLRSAEERDRATRWLRETACGCGCRMTLAECRERDPNCPRSPIISARIVGLVANGMNDEQIAEALASDGELGFERSPRPRPIPIVGAPQLGPRDALTVIGFGDFECPWSVQSSGVLRALHELYPDELRVVFKHFPLPESVHPGAHLAAEAAVASHEAGRFWEFHDRLFLEARRSGTGPDAEPRPFTRATLQRVARELGLDVTGLKQALSDGRYAARVNADVADGQRAGVRGTPTFFVGDQRLEGMRTLDDLRQFVEKALAARRRGDKP